MEIPTRLYLVRHGQTDLNREGRFRGMSDVPLNEDGRGEARGAAGLVRGADLVYSSPVCRAVETARIVAERCGADVVVDDGLIDIDYGMWQGLTVEEVAERFGAGAMESWRKDPGSFTFPGGESMRRVRDRLGPALGRIIGANSGGTVVVVSHLAVLKVCFLVAMDLGAPLHKYARIRALVHTLRPRSAPSPYNRIDWFWKIGLDNGSVSLFSYLPGSGFILEFWNCLPAP